MKLNSDIEVILGRVFDLFELTPPSANPLSGMFADLAFANDVVRRDDPDLKFDDGLANLETTR